MLSSMETNGAQFDWALEVTHASHSMTKVVVGFINVILILEWIIQIFPNILSTKYNHFMV